MEHHGTQESPPCKSTEKSPDLNFWGSIHEYVQGTSRKISSKSRKKSELKKKHKKSELLIAKSQWSHVLMAKYHCISKKSLNSCPPVISGPPRNSRAYPSPHSDLERELSRNFSKGYVLYIFLQHMYIYNILQNYSICRYMLSGIQLDVQQQTGDQCPNDTVVFADNGNEIWWKAAVLVGRICIECCFIPHG